LVTGGVAQVAKHEISASKIAQQQPNHAAQRNARDALTETGGVAPGAVVDATAPSDPAGATGTTGATGPADTATKPAETSTPTETTGKPVEVVDEENTTVVLPGGRGGEPSPSTGDAAAGVESPGLPTAPAGPTATPPSGPTTPPAPPSAGSTGPLGSVSPASPPTGSASPSPPPATTPAPDPTGQRPTDQP
jgi:hypothetical protein